MRLRGIAPLSPAPSGDEGRTNKEGAKHVEAFPVPPLDAGSSPAASTLILFCDKIPYMKKLNIVLLFFLVTFLFPQEVKTRYADHSNFSRFVIESDTPLDYLSFYTGEFSVNLKIEGDINVSSIPDMDSKLFSSLSVQKQEGKTVITLRFRKSCTWKVFELTNPFRIVVDVRERPRGNILKSFVRTIVLDPGHGGEELGAVGRNGTPEKKLTLVFARELKTIIERNLGIRVILTRDDDSFVSLDERTSIANNAKADLFISIHFNYSQDPTVKGPETYFLSYKATDSDARLLAYKENLGKIKEAPSSDIELILWDMAQSQYLYQSSRLAEMVQMELADEMGVTNRGIKQAPFAVLMGATMPAILVEVDFISNPEEEKLLLTSDYRRRLEMAIFRGIQKYIRSLR